MNGNIALRRTKEEGRREMNFNFNFKENLIMKKNLYVLIGGLVLSVVFIGGGISASAAPLSTNLSFASENFDYPDNYAAGDHLSGLDGGTGWDGAWDASGENLGVQEPNFDDWPGTFDTGNLPLALVEADGNVGRINDSSTPSPVAERGIANVPQAQAGDTYWMSALVLAGDSSHDADSIMTFDMIDAQGDVVWGYDMPTNANTTASLRVGEDTEGDPVEFTQGEVTSPADGKRGRWAISQLDYLGNGQADIYFWVLDEDDFPSGGIDVETWTPDTNNATASLLDVSVGSLDFESLRMGPQQSGGDNRIDRLNVTYIPEPSSLVLLGLSALLLMKRRRV